MGDRQLSVTTIDIPASSFTNIDFTIGQGVDQEEGYVLVEDYPLSFDNILYFNRKSVNKVNISHIHSNTSGQYVSAVYGNSALFNLVTMPESNINYTALEGSDIIILNGLTALDTNLAERVRSLRSRGVTVLIIPPESPDINTYRLLADRLRTIGKLDEDIDLEAPDFNRPFYKNVLERRDNNLRMPVAQPVWSWGGDRNALVKFIDGQPFLSELYRGFYLLASPLDNAYTNFQHNALFVPIMYRIAANSKQNIDPLYYRIDGNEISVAYENLESNAIIRLKNDDIEFLPDQRLTGRSIEMLLPTGVVPAGHYNILNNQEEIKKIALNYKTDESDIIASTEDDLIETFMGYDYNILSGSGSKEIVTKFSADYKGIMLWRYFLGLALVFLFIEALLIRLL